MTEFVVQTLGSWRLVGNAAAAADCSCMKDLGDASMMDCNCLNMPLGSECN